MKSNLESFRPKLRTGRVIPQGSRIIFETDNPYNQIILPMVLADLVLLCSGQFPVREIVEKIYKKQRAVPFKSILTAIYVLHKGGFFENGEELVLSSDLRSWIDPRKSRWHLSWRFGQRMVADKRSPAAYYSATLALLILSIVGLQFIPAAPLEAFERGILAGNGFASALAMLKASSILMTLKYALRGWQLLLLTGKAYNVSLRLSPWGLHLHVGNEANDLFENPLYTTMFYISQILLPWGLIFTGSYFIEPSALEPFVTIAMALSFWELNPFVNSDGLRLLQALLLSNDRDVASWHFESNQLIDSISPEQRRQDQDFSRICAIWGATWLVFSFWVLHEFAVVFGPWVLRSMTDFSWRSAAVPTAALLIWLFALYSVVQSLVETVAASLIRPYWRRWADGVQRFKVRSQLDWDKAAVATKIESLPLFSHFHEEQLEKIVARSQVLEFDPGAVIIHEGVPARELFVLLDGQVEIVRAGRAGVNEWLTELNAVSVFGEAALVDDQPRLARVVSRGAVHVLCVPIQVLRQAAQEAQSIRYLEDFRNAILVNQFFASSAVFRSLSTASVEFLSSRGSLEYFDTGQIVFNQGDMGDSLFLILRGSVDVTVHEQTVKTLAQGNFFGEISLIANIPRTATVTAAEPSVFFRISADAFWEVLVQHIDLGVFIEAVSESRLREDLEAMPFKKTGSES